MGPSVGGQLGRYGVASFSEVRHCWFDFSQTNIKPSLCINPIDSKQPIDAIDYSLDLVPYT